MNVFRINNELTHIWEEKDMKKSESNWILALPLQEAY